MLIAEGCGYRNAGLVEDVLSRYLRFLGSLKSDANTWRLWLSQSSSSQGYALEMLALLVMNPRKDRVSVRADEASKKKNGAEKPSTLKERENSSSQEI